MHTFLTFISALAFTVVNGHPVNEDFPGPIKTVGRACTGTGLSAECTPLILEYPNTCKTTINGDLPFDRTIASFEITADVPCAFFSLQTCINPKHTRAMVAQGQIVVNEVPSVLSHSIQAYLCGSAATEYFTDQEMAEGTTIIHDGTQKIRKNEGSESLIARQPCGPPSNDGRVATVFKAPNLSGNNPPQDKTAIPGHNDCTNMDNLYGCWDQKIRSLWVEPDYRCQFHFARDCQGAALEVGKKRCPDPRFSLDALYDQKIRSVHCAKI